MTTSPTRGSGNRPLGSLVIPAVVGVAVYLGFFGLPGKGGQTRDGV